MEKPQSGKKDLEELTIQKKGDGQAKKPRWLEGGGDSWSVSF